MGGISKISGVSVSIAFLNDTLSSFEQPVLTPFKVSVQSLKVFKGVQLKII
jgi:hypothetical protein